MTITPGSRTLIGVLFALTCLLVGLALIVDGQRGAAYGAFSLAVVGVIGVLGTKASVDSLSQGDGTKGAWANLTTSKRPGEVAPILPVDPAAPPPAGTVETTTKTTVTP